MFGSSQKVLVNQMANNLNLSVAMSAMEQTANCCWKTNSWNLMHFTVASIAAVVE